jgi:hypothetical protein
MKKGQLYKDTRTPGTIVVLFQIGSIYLFIIDSKNKKKIGTCQASLDPNDNLPACYEYIGDLSELDIDGYIIEKDSLKQ